MIKPKGLASMKLPLIAKENILQCIGNTPIVSLKPIAPHLSVNLFGKCEYLNPSGSIKDRIGLYMIEMAEKKGLLKPGGTIIEATSGNTGMGLAMAAALRGYKCIFVMADKQSQEKQLALKAMGAKIIICPTDVPADDERSYYKVAEKLARDIPNSFYANQYVNQDNPDTHYFTTGPEIYQQCGDSLDYLILGIGTGGSVSGISRYIKEKNPQCKVIGVDPIGSIYYDLFYNKIMINPKTYLIEGIGEDFLPKTMDLSCMDEIVQVNDKESFLMARRLIRELGLLVGGSTGSAVLGAIKYFERNNIGPSNNPKNALVILVDSFSRYLSKYLDDDWMNKNGLLDGY
jgi:cystathionine beta-synthase